MKVRMPPQPVARRSSTTEIPMKAAIAPPTALLALLQLLLLTLLLSLAACGPKNVGEDTLKADEGYTNPANEPEAQLRYPISGNRIEQRLFYMNQPHVMIERQQRQRDYFDRRMGEPSTPGRSAPNDYNNLTPRQASPFRQ